MSLLFALAVCGVAVASDLRIDHDFDGLSIDDSFRSEDGLRVDEYYERRSISTVEAHPLRDRAVEAILVPSHIVTKN